MIIKNQFHIIQIHNEYISLPISSTIIPRMCAPLSKFVDPYIDLLIFYPEVPL